MHERRANNEQDLSQVCVAAQSLEEHIHARNGWQGLSVMDAAGWACRQPVRRHRHLCRHCLRIRDCEVSAFALPMPHGVHAMGEEGQAANAHTLQCAPLAVCGCVRS